MSGPRKRIPARAAFALPSALAISAALALEAYAADKDSGRGKYAAGGAYADAGSKPADAGIRLADARTWTTPPQPAADEPDAGSLHATALGAATVSIVGADSYDQAKLDGVGRNDLLEPGLHEISEGVHIFTFLSPLYGRHVQTWRLRAGIHRELSAGSEDDDRDERYEAFGGVPPQVEVRRGNGCCGGSHGGGSAMHGSLLAVAAVATSLARRKKRYALRKSCTRNG
jgi:hypothetical protein